MKLTIPIDESLELKIQQEMSRSGKTKEEVIGEAMQILTDMTSEVDPGGGGIAAGILRKLIDEMRKIQN